VSAAADTGMVGSEAPSAGAEAERSVVATIFVRRQLLDLAQRELRLEIKRSSSSKLRSAASAQFC